MLSRGSGRLPGGGRVVAAQGVREAEQGATQRPRVECALGQVGGFPEVGNGLGGAVRKSVRDPSRREQPGEQRGIDVEGLAHCEGLGREAIGFRVAAMQLDEGDELQCRDGVGISRGAQHCEGIGEPGPRLCVASSASKSPSCQGLSSGCCPCASHAPDSNLGQSQHARGPRRSDRP